MNQQRNEELDRIVLRASLENLVNGGNPLVRASDLTRESSRLGYRVPKKYVRRRLTENGEGVTGIGLVRVIQGPNKRFWFSLTGPLQGASVQPTAGVM